MQGRIPGSRGFKSPLGTEIKKIPILGIFFISSPHQRDLKFKLSVFRERPAPMCDAGGGIPFSLSPCVGSSGSETKIPLVGIFLLGVHRRSILPGGVSNLQAPLCVRIYLDSYD